MAKVMICNRFYNIADEHVTGAQLLLSLMNSAYEDMVEEEKACTESHCNEIAAGILQNADIKVD